MTILDLQRERGLNIEDLQVKVADLHPVVQDALSSNRIRIWDAMSREELPKFLEGDFVLVAWDNFTAGEKLSLRFHGPRTVEKALSNYVFQAEDLRNAQVQDVHGTRLKFYHDPSLDKEDIMSHLIASETGMSVQRLMELVETEDAIQVQVRWHGLPESEDTLEPVARVAKDVPQLFRKLLGRKNVSRELVANVRQVLKLWEGVCDELSTEVHSFL